VLNPASLRTVFTLQVAWLCGNLPKEYIYIFDQTEGIGSLGCELKQHRWRMELNSNISKSHLIFYYEFILADSSSHKIRSGLLFLVIYPDSTGQPP